MRVQKKLFKHGGSLAVVIPSEFTKKLNSNEVSIEVSFDENNNPKLTVTPINQLDQLESDPNFALFVEAIYRDALENPEKLKTSEEVWTEEIRELIKDVQIDDE